MRAEDVAKALNPVSFRPLVLTVSTGQQYTVTHPEQAIVDRSAITLGLSRRDGHRLFERTVIIALVHVVSMTPVDEAEAA